jgi:hypothetical protein
MAGGDGARRAADEGHRPRSYVGFSRMNAYATPATGYEPGTTIDGIELRDRVWLDISLAARSV